MLTGVQCLFFIGPKLSHVLGLGYFEPGDLIREGPQSPEVNMSFTYGCGYWELNKTDLSKG